MFQSSRRLSWMRGLSFVQIRQKRTKQRRTKKQRKTTHCKQVKKLSLKLRWLSILGS